MQHCNRAIELRLRVGTARGCEVRAAEMLCGVLLLRPTARTSQQDAGTGYGCEVRMRLSFHGKRLSGSRCGFSR